MWWGSVVSKNRKKIMSLGITEFYKKVLPSKGTYCVSTIDRDQDGKRTRHFYVDTIEEVETEVKKIQLNIKITNKPTNIFVCPMSFKNSKRGGDNAAYFKSMYVDLDVGETKDYPSREAAEEALDKFVIENDFPTPVKVNSGNGLHAYWCFGQDIEAAEWKGYADKFRLYCLSKGLQVDKSVYDLARVLRCPDTLNYKKEPGLAASVMSDTIDVYDFEGFKEFLGVLEPSTDQVLKQAKKGMTEEERRMHGLDNHEYKFSVLTEKSMEGQGCNQIKYMLENSKTLSRNYWAAGLTIVRKCVDFEEGIEAISKDYEGYNYEEALKTADAGWHSPRTCEWFIKEHPEHCEGCVNKGRINTPIVLARKFREVPIAILHTPSQEVLPPELEFEDDDVEEEWIEQPLGRVITQELEHAIFNPNAFYIPDELRPFKHGATGGIYKELAPVQNTKTKQLEHRDPVLVTIYNVLPMRRVWNKIEGYSLEIRVVFPFDEPTVFLFPMKFISDPNEIGRFFGTRGVNIKRGAILDFMEYLNLWGEYLSFKGKSELLRTQMGWTDDTKSAFTVGTKEYRKDGTVVDFPLSALTENSAVHLTQKGSYENWKKAANLLNTDGLEVHAFCMLGGFSSVLMNYSNTPGATISLSGASGGAKSGALFSALSAWGNPEGLYFHTNSGMTGNNFRGRMLAMHNIPLGIDEVTNIQPDILSELIHLVSAGKPKGRMYGSINAERPTEASASLLTFMTTNQANYAKLAVHKHDPNGEVARLIEFELGQPKPLNEDPNFAARLFETLKHNYGWAGPKFVQAIMDLQNKGEIIRHYTMEEDHKFGPRIEKWVERFRKDYGFNSANRFYNNIIGLTCFAGDVCNEYDIVNIDVEKVYKHISKEMINIKTEVIQINTIDYENIISEFLHKHHANMLVMKGGIALSEPKGSLIIRDDVDLNTVFISRSVFNSYLTNDLSINTSTFKSKVKDSNIGILEKRIRLNEGWKGAASNEYNVWTYAFKLDKKIEVIPSD
jgi:hypothetical protein